MPDVFVAKKRNKESSSATKADTESKNTLDDEATKEKAEKKRVKGTIFYPKTHKERNKLPGHTHFPLASFCYFPDHVRFVNQDPKERVVLFLRKHPATNIGWISLTALLIITPTFFPVFTLFDLFPGEFQIVFVMVWYLITTAFIFEKFLSWYFHVNMITDERIIEVDFLHLVYREITDANIDQIQDVTVVVGSALRTTFNFGDVVIQTAAQIPKITFEAVPQPDRVAKILRELRIEEEVEKLEGRVR